VCQSRSKWPASALYERGAQVTRHPTAAAGRRQEQPAVADHPARPFRSSQRCQWRPVPLPQWHAAHGVRQRAVQYYARCGAHLPGAPSSLLSLLVSRGYMYPVASCHPAFPALFGAGGCAHGPARTFSARRENSDLLFWQRPANPSRPPAREFWMGRPAAASFAGWRQRTLRGGHQNGGHCQPEPDADGSPMPVDSESTGRPDGPLSAAPDSESLAADKPTRAQSRSGSGEELLRAKSQGAKPRSESAQRTFCKRDAGGHIRSHIND
jgi:hypothetical protein